MKILTKNFIFSLFFSFLITSEAFAVSAKSRPTIYKSTVHVLQMCETGSTIANCKNPVILKTSTAGETMDIGIPGSVKSFGNAGLMVPGKTYSHGQVIMSRTFIIGGIINTTGTTWCETGNTTGGSLDKDRDNGAGGVSNTASGGSSDVDFGNSSLKVTSGTGKGDYMNSTSAIAGGVDQIPGTLDTDDEFVKFRWQLTSPFTVKNGEIPTMVVTFDLSDALEFNDGDSGNGACDGRDLYPGRPVITNTFK